MKPKSYLIALALLYGQALHAWGDPFEISGTILADAGKPLTNIAVRAFPVGTWLWQSTVSALTDASGHYHLSVTNGMWQVQPVLPQLTNQAFRYLPARQVQVNDSNTVVDFIAETIPFTTPVSGMVVDEQNRPMSDVVVSAQGLTRLACSTDSQGRFEFLLGAGSWSLVLDGALPQLQERLTPICALTVAEGVAQRNLRLVVVQPNRQIDGSVKNVDQAWIFAEMLTNGQSYRISQSTTLNGQFQLGVMDGIWTISASATSYQFPDKTVSVAGTNQAITLEGRLLTNSAATTLLSGRVADNRGEPLAGWTVYASSSRSVSGVTSTNGYFELMVEPGLWNLGFSSGEAETSGFLTPSTLSLQAHTNSPGLTNLQIIAQRTDREIPGVLRDTAGRPIPNVAINVSAEYKGARYSASAYTDAQGSFRLKVFEANWRLTVNALDLNQRGYLGLPELGIAASPTNLVIPLVVQPMPARVLARGRIVDEAGSPVSGYYLFLATLDGSFALQTTTDGDGRFGLPAFPGSWRMSGSSRDTLSYRRLPAQILMLDAVDQTADFILKSTKPTAQLKGKVISDSGIPLSGLLVSAGNNEASFQALTAEDGTFEIGLFGGEWNITLESAETARRGLITPAAQTLLVRDGVNPGYLELVARHPDRIISGTLLDPAGKPLLGRAVYAYSSAQGLYYSQTTYPDSLGRYLLPVFEGSWRISVESYQGDDYLRWNTQLVRVEGSDQELNFLFQPRVSTTRLSGRVVDELNNPVAGIWVYANHSQSSLSTLTDVSGLFAFNLYAGSWSLNLNSYQGQQRSWLVPAFSSAFSLQAGADQTNHVLVMKQANRQISGILHDEEGHPLANKGVSARVNLDGTYYGTSATTDLGGRYTLQVCEGFWQLSTWLGQNDGYLRTVDQPVKVEGTDLAVNLSARQLVPSAYLGGRVIDSKGVPMPHIDVSASHSLATLKQTTDAQGYFNLAVIPGRWNLSVDSSQAADRGCLSLTLAPGPNAVHGTTNNNLILVMQKADRKIAGVIQDDQGQPLGGVGVSASHYDNNLNYGASTVSDSSGKFTLWVNDGVWQVATSLGQSDGYLHPPDKSVIVNGVDQTFNITASRYIPTAHLRGRVMDSEGHSWAHSPVRASHRDVSLSTTTDDLGYFNIGAIAGDWELRAIASEVSTHYVLASSLILTNQVKDGVNLSNLVLVAHRPTVRISGSIKDKAGNPVTSIPIAISARLGTTNLWAQEVTGTNGQFTLEVIPGTWKIAFDGACLNAQGFQCLPWQDVAVDATTQFSLDLVVPRIQGDGLAPVLHAPIRSSAGMQSWRLESQADNLYRILASTDLSHWSPFLTNSTRYGTIEFTDPEAKKSPKRFYRGQLLP